MTAGSLLDPEIEAVGRLTGPLTREAATLAVVLVTREHARPEPELAHVIRQYQGLEELADARAAIAELRGREWLSETAEHGTAFLRAVGDLDRRLAELVGDPAFAQQLRAARSVAEASVRVLGPMSQTAVYGTYLEVLREAQSEIRLPMLATSPALSAIPILCARAELGVRVRVLLGAPAVVAHYRGKATRRTAEDVVAGWAEHARRQPNLEVRLCQDPRDLIVASCASVDDRLLRFDVYDPEHQRSLDGQMLEVRSPRGRVQNLHRLFARHFDEAWERAKPTSRLGSLRWRIERFWQAWLAVPLLAVCAIAGGSGTVGAVSASLAAACLFETARVHWPQRWMPRRRRA